MTTYFFTETTGAFVYSTAQRLNAKTLRGAKNEAERRRIFDGTTLKIATLEQVTKNNGLIVDYVAIKHFKKWCNVG